MAKRGPELRVLDLLLDERAHSEPRLDLGRVLLEVGQDEAVGVGDADLAVFEEAELGRVDRATPPAPWVEGQLLGAHRHPPYHTTRALRPAVGEVVAEGDLGLHVLCLPPGALFDRPAGPPGSGVALGRDREVRPVTEGGEGDVAAEKARVDPDDRARQALRQGSDGPSDERSRLGARVRASRAQVRTEHDAGLGPHRRVGAAHALALVVEAHTLLGGSVDLHVGRVEVDRRARRGQLGATGLGEQVPPATHERRVRPLDPGEHRSAEALGPADEGGGGGDLAERAKRPSRLVTALVVQVDHEVPAGEHRLGHRDDERSGRQAPPAGRRSSHLGVDGGHDPKDALELGDEVQACAGREARVGCAKADTADRTAYPSHLTGAFLCADAGC